MSNFNNDLVNRQVPTQNVFVVILEKWPSITSFTVPTTLTSAQEQYLPSLAAKPILEHYCTVT